MHGCGNDTARLPLSHDHARVSVMLLTDNDMTTLLAVLEAVTANETDWPFEFVAIDSGVSGARGGRILHRRGA